MKSEMTDNEQYIIWLVAAVIMIIYMVAQ